MIDSMVFLLLTLPGDNAPPDRIHAPQPPSLELLEYIGAMEEDQQGRLLDPLELPSTPVQQHPPESPTQQRQENARP